MASIIRSDNFGVSAFTEDHKLVMNSNHPCVFWSFRVRDLEKWVTTLEELHGIPGNEAHWSALAGLIGSLRAAHDKHVEQHEEVVTDAPTGDDLMEYLVAYAASMATPS
jgi:hypothetical protein